MQHAASASARSLSPCTSKSQCSVDSVKIHQALTTSLISKDGIYNLKINVPSLPRRPVSIICIIDVSGSMGSTVGKGEGRKAFTRLDLVKHVLNVLINSLEPTDYLSLITFSDKPTLNMALSEMKEANVRLAKNHVNRMHTISNTYTSPAIKLAYEEIKKSPLDNINSIVLLTDGQDTAGEDTLQRQFDLIKKPDNVQFSTFGFSNDIWSNSLKTLATKGNGIFGFIPDQTMIGTIFINFLASTFLTYSQESHLILNDDFEFVFPKFSGQNTKNNIIHWPVKEFPHQKKSKSASAAGTNDVVAKLKLSNKETIEMKNKSENDNLNFDRQQARKKLLEFLTNTKLTKEIVDTYLNCEELQLQEFLSEFKQIDEYNPNNEQLALAVTFYDTWGQHYIRSMYFSHQYEQCLNFKSPSMQIYSNERFAELVDKLTEIFVTLPLPEPSGYCYDESTNVPQINTRYLMDRDSGCILGSCRVKMASGEYKELSKLRKEESVFGGAKVKCVIKSRYSGSLIKIGKLFITPFHPVLIDNQWQFPFDIYNNNSSGSGSSKRGEIVIESPDNTYVYNIVLDREHVIDVDGIECITLGHGKDSGILRHDYFGTNRVIDDLSKLRGWQEGFISLQSYKIKRDDRGNVCGTCDHIYNNDELITV